MKEACVSSGTNARRTSDVTRSRILHLGVTPHTVLSRTRRGSFPSARTTLSLPAAIPCLACSMGISVRTTHPLEISFSKRADTVSGSASACDATRQLGEGSCDHALGEGV